MSLFTLVSPGERLIVARWRMGKKTERKNVLVTIPAKSVLIIFLVGNKRST